MKLSQLAANFDAVLDQLREADVSFSDRRQALSDAIRADEYNSDGSYRYVEEVYDDYFIFQQHGEEAASSGYFKATYTLNTDGIAIIGDATRVQRVVTWEDVATEAERIALEGSELIEGACVALAEAAQVASGGEILIKVISPGWNEAKSAYYGADMLKRDCAEAFPVGTKMFWNHPTAQEAKDQPERDCDKIAAVFIEAAKWNENGAAGPGPYAKARVKEMYRAKVKDLVPDIANSIYARGKMQAGEAEGHKGRIVTQLLASKQNTVDFVTYPGAGGEIVQMFESARPVASNNPGKNDMTPEQIEALKAENAALKVANAQLSADTATAVAEAAQLRLTPIAREAAKTALAPMKMPEVTRQNVIEAMASAPVLNAAGELDSANFAVAVKEAATKALTYLEVATGQKFVPSTSPVRGAGSAGTVVAEAAKPAAKTQSGADRARAAISGLI